MKNSNAEPIDDEISKALRLSIAFHGFLFVVLVVRAVFMPTEILRSEQAIRVDMVALPDKQATLPVEQPKAESKPEPPPPEPVQESKPDKKPEPLPVKVEAKPKIDTNKINLEKTKKAQELAVKRLQALAQVEEQLKAEKSKTKVEPRKNAPIKGNEKVAGNSLSGIARLDFDSYDASLDAHVKKYWALPEWLRNAKLRMRVKIYIDASGNLLKKQIISESKNPMFNERVLDAIERATPFPHPPAGLVNFMSVEGVELNFDSEH